MSMMLLLTIIDRDEYVMLKVCLKDKTVLDESMVWIMMCSRNLVCMITWFGSSKLLTY